jgi:ABC-type branched-subunit amino acid transport system permease subunit
MSRKRSDILDGPASPSAPRDGATSGASPWWATLRSNGPLPIALLLLFFLGWFVEGRAFGAYNQRIVMLVGFNVVLAVSLQLINGFSGQFSLGHAGFMAVGAYLAAYPALNHSQRLTNPAESLLFFLALLAACAVAAAGLYAVFVVLRLTRKIHPSLPPLLLVAVLAWIVADVANASKHEVPPAYFVWSKAIALLQDSFNWIIAHGAPAATRVSGALPEAARKPLTYLVLLIGGGCGAAAAGLVVGLPTLRLRGDYLAIATLGMAEIIRIGIQNARPLGGALGLTGIPKYTNFAWLYGIALLTIVVIWRLAYSAKGRAIMAVREDEIAAASIGVDPTHHKVVAFVIGAFFAGVAGAAFALHERSITPSYFGFQKSIEIVAMVTLGGLGSISGAILAAAVLTLLPEVLRPIAAYRMIIYALLLITMMLLRPQGLLGGRELWPWPWWRGRRASSKRGFAVTAPPPTLDQRPADNAAP